MIKVTVKFDVTLDLSENTWPDPWNVDKYCNNVTPLHKTQSQLKIYKKIVF